MKQQAVRLTRWSPDKPGLNNLRSSFDGRFWRLGNLADVNEVITVKQQAVRLTLLTLHVSLTEFLGNSVLASWRPRRCQ